MTALLLCRFAQTAAAVLLAGAQVQRLLARGTAPVPRPRGQWLAAGSWAGLVVTGLLQLGLTAAAMSGRPLAEALSPGVLAGVLSGTRFGAVWLVRAVLLAAMPLVPSLVPAGRGCRRPVAAEVAGVLLAAAVLASLVWSGHGAASGHRAWLLPVGVLHVVAAGAWPGGLLPLGLLLARARREPAQVAAALTITRRFSRLSVAAVGVLALTGLLNGVGMLGSPPALWTQPYGWLLCAKVALFAGMVGLGAVNRRLIRREAAGNDPAETLRWLGRNVAWESALGALVLWATAALAMTPPPT